MTTWRWLAVVIILMGMVSCSTSKKDAAVVDPQKALAQTQWYHATREPLTYCPNGYVLKEKVGKRSLTDSSFYKLG